MDWHRIVNGWTRRVDRFKASWGIDNHRLEPVEPRLGQTGSNDRKPVADDGHESVHRDTAGMSVHMEWRPRVH